MSSIFIILILAIPFIYRAIVRAFKIDFKFKNIIYSALLGISIFISLISGDLKSIEFLSGIGFIQETSLFSVERVLAVLLLVASLYSSFTIKEKDEEWRVEFDGIMGLLAIFSGNLIGFILICLLHSILVGNLAADSSEVKSSKSISSSLEMLIGSLVVCIFLQEKYFLVSDGVLTSILEYSSPLIILVFVIKQIVSSSSGFNIFSTGVKSSLLSHFVYLALMVKFFTFISWNNEYIGLIFSLLIISLLPIFLRDARRFVESFYFLGLPVIIALLATSGLSTVYLIFVLMIGLVMMKFIISASHENREINLITSGIGLIALNPIFFSPLYLINLSKTFFLVVLIPLTLIFLIINFEFVKDLIKGKFQKVILKDKELLVADLVLLAIPLFGASYIYWLQNNQIWNNEVFFNWKYSLYGFIVVFGLVMSNTAKVEKYVEKVDFYIFRSRIYKGNAFNSLISFLRSFAHNFFLVLGNFFCQLSMVREGLNSEVKNQNKQASDAFQFISYAFVTMIGILLVVIWQL